MDFTKAQIQDADEILALQKLCYKEIAEYYGEPGMPPMIQSIESMREQIQTQTVLKCIKEGRIAGSVRGYEKEGTCFIGRVIVHPDFRRQGIARQMMAAIENSFPDCRRFELFTGHKSTHLIGMYGKMGYKEYKKEMITPNVSHVLMEKQVKTEDKG